MKDYPQEIYARELYARLEEKFADKILNVRLTIQGKGVNWRCTANREENFCKIVCIHYPHKGREYALYFEHNKQRMAFGRTPSPDDTVAAVDSWLHNASLDELYKNFGFVDKHKRAFEALTEQIIGFYPEIASFAEYELRSEFGDLYELFFYNKERRCLFKYWGRNELPDCFFDWDNCNLLKVQNGNIEQLALAMKRWLCDFAMPSAMEREFSWLNFGKLGYYYEQGRGIEGEFVVSWDKIEGFFQRFSSKLAWVPEALTFIRQLRQHGYDHTLRAGQSLTTFILSRSRRHGMKPEQPYIVFGFRNDGIQITTYVDGTKTLNFPVIELNEEINTELKKLEAKEID
jgi:hypothetical protein